MSNQPLHLFARTLAPPGQCANDYFSVVLGNVIQIVGHRAPDVEFSIGFQQLQKNQDGVGSFLKLRRGASSGNQDRVPSETRRRTWTFGSAAHSRNRASDPSWYLSIKVLIACSDENLLVISLRISMARSKWLIPDSATNSVSETTMNQSQRVFSGWAASSGSKESMRIWAERVESPVRYAISASEISRQSSPKPSASNSVLIPWQNPGSSNSE